MLTKTLFAAFALTTTAIADEQPAEKQDPSPEAKPPGSPTEVALEAPDQNPELAEKATTSQPPAATTEHTVKVAPFTIKSEIDGILVPTKTQTFALEPKRWKAFSIESVPDHGTAIKKGEPLIIFKSEAIDKKLRDQETAIKEQEIKLAIANRELTELQQKNALSLAATKRRMDHAEADLAYYESIGQSAKKESLVQSLQQIEDFLSYQKEELNQLLKMYEEDDITEETEEIILVRQKARVRDAENSVKERKRQNAFALKATLPRELIDYQAKVETARIDYATAKLNLSRKYELKKLEVSKLELALADAREVLAETQEDRELFEVVAEFDGNLLYGEFVDGQWRKGKTPEFLKPGGNVPTRTTVLTLVASDSPLALHALLETEKVVELQASLEESGESAPKLKISSYPNLNGKHLVATEAKAPEPFHFPGQKEKAELVFYQAEKAITIPSEALKEKEDGTPFVMLKLSEGEPEERTVTLGKKDDQVSEILTGLEEGQVILH